MHPSASPIYCLRSSKPHVRALVCWQACPASAGVAGVYLDASSDAGRGVGAASALRGLRDRGGQPALNAGRASPPTSGRAQAFSPGNSGIGAAVHPRLTDGLPLLEVGL